MRTALISEPAEVSAIVDAKAPEEAAASKVGSARSARRSQKNYKRGLFLGFGGVRVSDAETATLRDTVQGASIAIPRTEVC